MRTREEQIEEMVQVNSAYLCHEDYTPDTLRMMIAAAISEAEERARAECAADTRRLEWLEKLPFADVGRLPNGWEICINNVRHWDMQPTLREAIDAAMEGGE
ncbi:hypothetical protein [Acetobacter pasteurianus]|uniref:hypothetical protein n=1 Tax=Acetobacter pasteurianus TaxID=438 RepID=UPI003D096D23